MGANFTPNYVEPNKTGLFRFWSQKVLPAVYDDSLSYYELLCKVVNNLNDVIKQVDTTTENVNKLYQAYTNLQDYVNHYFDNLNVQNEINNKLDTMASDGTLDEIINNEIFSNINYRLNFLYERKILCIGDSYGAGSQLEDGEIAWPVIVRNRMGLTENVNWWNFSKGGCSFGISDINFNFLLMAQNAVAQIDAETRNTITDIVVGGGLNDWSYNNDEIATGMHNFKVYVKEHFPRAKVHIMCFGWAKNPKYRSRLEQTYHYYGRNGMSEGFIVYNDMCFILQNANRFSADNIHPNASGQAIIGNSVYNVLNGGLSYADNPLKSSLTLKLGNGASTPVGSVTRNGNCVVLRTITGTIDIPSTNLSVSMGKLCDIECYQLFGCDPDVYRNDFVARCVLNGSTSSPAVEDVNFRIILTENGPELHWQLYARNENAWATYDVTSLSIVGDAHVIPIYCA